MSAGPRITDRIDAISRIAPAYRTATPPTPRSVKIELTSRCNYGCTFCARSFRLREEKDMDRPPFERLLPEKRAAGVEGIGLFYLGESFLSDWLVDAVAYAKRRCGFPYVFLTTNGSVATLERMEGCFRADLDSPKFSYNYADAAQFEEIARVRPRLFEAMKRNIKAARAIRDAVAAETGRFCGLYASSIEYDAEQKDRMRAAVDEIPPRVDEVYSLRLYNQANLATEREQALGWKSTPGNRGRICAIRCPAGRSSPKAISPGTASSQPAASIRTAASTRQIFPRRRSSRAGTARHSSACALRI